MRAALLPPVPNAPIFPEGSANHQTATPFPARGSWQPPRGRPPWACSARTSHLNGAPFLSWLLSLRQCLQGPPVLQPVQSAAPGHGENVPFPGSARIHQSADIWVAPMGQCELPQVLVYRCPRPVFQDLRWIPRGQRGVLGNSACFCEEPPHRFHSGCTFHIPPAAHKGLES